jgi:hypothetical protein
MSELAHLLLLLLFAGVAVTALGAAAVWFMDEERRMRRAFRNVLGAEPEAMVIARGRGRAAGFNFSRGALAVAWDSGAWCLLYRLQELYGLELIVDGQVAARTQKGQPSKPLDSLAPAADHVALRLYFEDPHHPDFDLDLWFAGDELRRRPHTAVEAMKEAKRWVTRVEAVLRRAPARRPAAPAPGPQLRRAAPIAAVAATGGAAAAGQTQLPFGFDDEDDDALHAETGAFDDEDDQGPPF